MHVTHRTFKTCRVCKRAVPMPHLHQTHLVSNSGELMHLNMFDESEFVCETCRRSQRLELSTRDGDIFERPRIPAPEVAVQRGMLREDLNQAMAHQLLRIEQTRAMIDLAAGVEACVAASVVHSYSFQHDRAITLSGHLSFGSRLRAKPHAGAEMALEQVQEDPDTSRRMSAELAVINEYVNSQEPEQMTSVAPISSITLIHFSWWLAGLSISELIGQEESETTETVQNEDDAFDAMGETELPSRVYEGKYGHKVNLSTNF